MRRAIAITLAGLATAALGCGSSDPASTPSACLAGPSAYLDALHRAPNPVRLGGTTAISDCLTDEQGAGDIAQVGNALLKAATELNAGGRRNPDGPAPVELGYLVGAVRRGAAGTAGIHQDLVRRVEAAARFAPHGRRLPGAFNALYGGGVVAGQHRG